MACIAYCVVGTVAPRIRAPPTDTETKRCRYNGSLRRSYRNHLPHQLPQELKVAEFVGVVPVVVPSTEFDMLAAEGERMIYVVTGDRLLVSKRTVMGEHITHAVLAAGYPVQAAGEFEVVDYGDLMTVMELNNVSGHYQPRSESLDVATEAFEKRGLRVLTEGVEQYDGWRP